MQCSNEALNPQEETTELLTVKYGKSEKHFLTDLNTLIIETFR